MRGPGGAPREGGGGGGPGGSGGDEGWGDEGDKEAAAKRMNEERESRVMQVYIAVYSVVVLTMLCGVDMEMGVCGKGGRILRPLHG